MTLTNGSLARRTGLVVAIDLEERSQAEAVASAVAPSADALKVGWPTVLGCGIDVVGLLQRASGRPVICDFKIADIPSVASAIARRAIDAGAAGVICHAFAGRESVAAVASECHARGVLPIAVVEMSHEGGREFTEPASVRLLEAALAGGARAVVAPATRPERIGAIHSRYPDLLIFSPGAGAQGGSPAQASRAGADFVIVGRSVAMAANPAAAAREAASEIAAGLAR